MNRVLRVAALAAVALFAASAEQRMRVQPVPLTAVTIQDEFWAPRREVWQKITINDAWTKFENDRGGALINFDRVRDGKQGGHAGPPWYDGLIYEMIRASSDFLAAHPDPALDKRLDGYIARIAAAAARHPHGYVNTYTQLVEPGHEWGLNGGFQRWQHEVYNLGMLTEAGVHHYRATGKTSLLQVAVTVANYMTELMGPPPKRAIIPTHSGPEEALIELHLLFKQQTALERRLKVAPRVPEYRKLVEFWIESRGRHIGQPDWTKGDRAAEDFIRKQMYGEGRPSWGAYAQDHKPVLEQETIEGHAVRATLLWTGVAAAARVNGREDYFNAAERIWNNMVSRRVHITGGTGAFAKDEKFGTDYELPNDAYLETCAAVGAAFFHRNMHLLAADARYMDELERVLYNGALSGVSLKGDTYFYENPLIAGKHRARWVWHDCPCCPPMFLKLMGAMPGYIYATDDRGIYVNLFVGSTAQTGVAGRKVSIRMSTRYPWDGKVRLEISPQAPAEFAVRVRVPAWARSSEFRVNGAAVAAPIANGYAELRQVWRPGGTLDVEFPMPVERVRAHPLVQADAGRVALMRGPLVYCIESADNDDPVQALALPTDSALSVEYRKDLLGGVAVIRGRAQVELGELTGSLYFPMDRRGPAKQTTLTAVPYYANANRGPVDMLVWVREAGAVVGK